MRCMAVSLGWSGAAPNVRKPSGNWEPETPRLSGANIITARDLRCLYQTGVRLPGRSRCNGGKTPSLLSSRFGKVQTVARTLVRQYIGVVDEDHPRSRRTAVDLLHDGDHLRGQTPAPPSPRNCLGTAQSSVQHGVHRRRRSCMLMLRACPGTRRRFHQWSR